MSLMPFARISISMHHDIPGGSSYVEIVEVHVHACGQACNHSWINGAQLWLDD